MDLWHSGISTWGCQCLHIINTYHTFLAILAIHHFCPHKLEAWTLSPTVWFTSWCQPKTWSRWAHPCWLKMGEWILPCWPFSLKMFLPCTSCIPSFVTEGVGPSCFLKHLFSESSGDFLVTMKLGLKSLHFFVGLCKPSPEMVGFVSEISFTSGLRFLNHSNPNRLWPVYIPSQHAH